jgi:hypothetical protein
MCQVIGAIVAGTQQMFLRLLAVYRIWPSHKRVGDSSNFGDPGNPKGGHFCHAQGRDWVLIQGEDIRFFWGGGGGWGLMATATPSSLHAAVNALSIPAHTNLGSTQERITILSTYWYINDAPITLMALVPQPLGDHVGAAKGSALAQGVYPGSPDRLAMLQCQGPAGRLP